MKNNLLFLLLFLSTIGMNAQSKVTSIEAKIDSMFNEQYSPDGPGVAVLVAKGGKVLYRKGFGMANIELGLPMKPDYVFRIGSITKQFTACAILKLAEEGKLSLDDDLLKFIPDYPSNGHKITVENLLNHTSGIKSYTGMMQWTDEVRRKDFTPVALIDFFKNEPSDFAPDEQWRYNNSAYFLLGYIIEKVSGMSYADYVEQIFFKPLGMKNSYYGFTDKIIPNRLPGYQKNGEHYENANFLSMTQPYAAGSLLSTVDDLHVWYQAVAEGKVVSRESLKKALASTRLKDGNTIGYGFGLSTGNVQGSFSYGHNGGINGFSTSSLYLPDEDIFVAILANCDCADLGDTDAKLAALALGKPYEWKTFAFDPAKLPEYQAVYEAKYNGERTISVKDGQLFSQVSGSRMYKLVPTGKDQFHVEESLTDLKFNRNSKGEIVAVTSTSRNEPIEWKRTDKQIKVREALDLPETILKQYVGEFMLFPEFVLVIKVENGKLTAEPTGQPKVILQAESELKFYVEEVDAHIEFVKNEAGQVDKLILHQGGQAMEAKKK